MADVDHPGGEVDVIPAQAEQFGEPHAGVGAGRKQRPVADGARGEQASELGLTEHAQARRRGMRALIPLQTGERVRDDVATAEGEAENAAERSEHPFDRPGREPLRLEFVCDRDEVVGRDQRDPAAAEPRQQMPSQPRAIEFKRALAPRTRGDLGLELSQPARCHLGEVQPRRERQFPDPCSLLQELALRACLGERSRVQSAKPRLPLTITQTAYLPFAWR